MLLLRDKFLWREKQEYSILKGWSVSNVQKVDPDRIPAAGFGYIYSASTNSVSCFPYCQYQPEFPLCRLGAEYSERAGMSLYSQ
jgi:hypothetical protein